MAARSKEERLALIDAKIAKKKEEIAALEEQKQKSLHPITMKAVLAKMKETGLTPEAGARSVTEDTIIQFPIFYQREGVARSSKQMIERHLPS